jgi:poly(3-hydroxybutyrate) depolymerase
MLMVTPLAGAETKLEKQLVSAGKNAVEIKGFIEAAAEGHGVLGKKAAIFLVEGMPERDLKSLDKKFLLVHLNLAMKARQQFPWAKTLPEDIFLNDVLPYASLDETREPWRQEFYKQCQTLVKECKTATEAAQAINKGFFKIINVHYNTGRKAPNQSPAESKNLGMATCTGLSIIMVDACRSVGVPARVAGTAMWSNKRGNHTWVEIYHDGNWFFTGADEYNELGLNKAWFVGDASKAKADDWKHAIWASSWKKADGHFPLVWNPQDQSVPGVNVTDRYAKPDGMKVRESTVYLRLWDKRGGKRLAAVVEIINSTGNKFQTVTSKAGTADMNDMAAAVVKTGVRYQLRITLDGEQRQTGLHVDKAGTITQDLVWNDLNHESASLTAVKNWLALPPGERHLSVPKGELSKKDAKEAKLLIGQTLRNETRAQRQRELTGKVVKAAGKEMRYHEKIFGKAKAGQRSLYISMHGGGGAPTRVNDQQWHNQIRLYAPKEGIVVAPRAPTDTWNLWHQGHIDDLFDRLIANFVLERGVSPDRIYLMGYSAGGDGVYQLAPRMADRFAAASMMAGHPNDANPLGLRNLPFMIFMGGNDRAYKRNEVAAEWGEKLAKLKQADGEGYEHEVTIYKGLGHWMNGRDSEALPWMAKRTRNPWPQKIVWHQSNRTHDRFYWLAVPKNFAKGGQLVKAEITGQAIVIEVETKGSNHLILRLSDELLDMDQPVTVTVNGKETFKGSVERNVQSIWDSLDQRLDPRSISTGVLHLKF